MENLNQLKVPITLVFVIVLQTSGFIWWTAQQASTLEYLKQSVEDITSRDANEELFNLKRDVIELRSTLSRTITKDQDQEEEINLLWSYTQDIDNGLTSLYNEWKDW
jgi:hypothetical protein